jgi:carboxyl-terminal processing protease
MKSFRIIYFLLTIITTTVYSQEEIIRKKMPTGAISSRKNNQISSEQSKIVGQILKTALETLHYRSSRLDDSVSDKAFKLFLEKMDSFKQFYLQSDVAELEKYRMLMDDELLSGEYKIVEDAQRILHKRIAQVEDFRKEIFKQNFDFTTSEKYQVDPDKRKFSANEAELKEWWRKSFKYAVMSRYLNLLEDQEDILHPKKNKEKNKKNIKKKNEKVEILTDEQLRQKAVTVISEKYQKNFARMLKEDSEEYIDNFYNSLTAVYDPHTNYFMPKKKEDFDIDISGSLEGIGAVLSEDGSNIKVVSIVPGGAAWKQKDLQADDIIEMVGQGNEEAVSLIDMKVDDAVRYIRGKKGTEVRLTVKKADGSRKVFSIIRDKVQVGESYAKSSILNFKDSAFKVGYIQLPKFYRDFNGKTERNCSEDVRKELESIKKRGVNAVILDLRNNGGGALEDARIMSGLFIEKGPIVQIRNTKGDTEVLEDDDKSITYDGPVVVLTNRFSASASEILAGALQDYGRAVVVGGEFTHGKGTVQAVVNLNQGLGMLSSFMKNDLGALKVTIQKFYRVTGASTQFKGVTPDIILPDSNSFSKSREQDLDYSLPWDKINGLPFNPWKKQSNDMNVLKVRSAARVQKSERYKKLSETISYITKRREDTEVTLNLEQLKKEEKEGESRSEEFKYLIENKNIMVNHFENSLKDGIADVKDPKDKKNWEEVLTERKNEWVKQLQQDPAIEEGLSIAEDMIKMALGQKLSFAK